MGPTPNAEVPSMRCSPPEPLVVMAKRNRDVLPFCGVRYMFVVVLLPKSKMRVQLAVEFNLTQVSMVQLLSVLTIAGGKLTYCCEPDDKINWPLEKVPPLGNVPVQVGPPMESATVVPLVSLKL